MPRIASASRAAWLAAVPLFVACGNEPTPPAPVASVEVSPDTTGVVLGRTRQLTARVRDAQGHDLAERPVTWTSSAPTPVSVSPNGLVTGLALGDSILIPAMSEQLGDGSTIDRGTPVAVSGGLGFATLSAEHVHTCGVTTGAVAFCWGLNRDGRLGADATGSCANGWPCATAPVRVTGQPGAAAARSVRVDARPQANSRVPSVHLRSSGRGLPPLAPSVHATRQ